MPFKLNTQHAIIGMRLDQYNKYTCTTVRMSVSFDWKQNKKESINMEFIENKWLKI